MQVAKLGTVYNGFKSVYEHGKVQLRTPESLRTKTKEEIEAKEKEFDDLLKQLKDCWIELGFNDITPERLHQEGYDDWLRIKEMPSYFTDIDRPGYEAFVQGYLCYYEEHCISKEEKERKNYTLYFDWSKTDAGKNDLIIYLKPIEDRTKFYHDYPAREPNPEEVKELEEKKLKEKEFGSTGANILRSPFPPPPSMTDPQQPPPPPPPKTNR